MDEMELVTNEGMKDSLQAPQRDHHIYYVYSLKFFFRGFLQTH